METFLAAVCQMTSGEDKQANIDQAVRLLTRAAGRGTKLAVLPEMFNCCGRDDVMVAQAEPIPGPTIDGICAQAAQLGIFILAGSIFELSDCPGKAHNTSVLIDSDGSIMARYRKVHLFDIDVPGKVTDRESDRVVAGEDVVAAGTPLGVLGLSICYDLRFPELYRRLGDRAAEIVCLPAAFTLPTGKDHWEVLIRARAVENQAYMLAANQCATHPNGITTYGRSMIVDPWGTVLACAGDGEGIAVAELSASRLEGIRESLPCRQHARLRP